LLFTSKYSWASTQETRISISACLAILLAALVVSKVIGRGYLFLGRQIEGEGWLGPQDEMLVATIDPDRCDILRKRNTVPLDEKWKNMPSIKHKASCSFLDVDSIDEMDKVVIGVLVLTYRPHEGKLSKKGRRVGRGWIRGWAVSRALS